MKFFYKGFLFFLFSILFLFSGCQNFFCGSELKKQLEKAIEIAKSDDISVEINLKNSKCGSISPAGIIKVKKEVPFKIELTVKNGYEFNGLFNVFEKSPGRTTRIKDSEEVIRFVETAKYDDKIGITNYVFEATIFTDNISSFLINPEILNPNSTEPPKILDAKIKSRYGDEANVLDYFDINLYVECDSIPFDKITTSFKDSYGNILDGESFDCVFDATIEDIGNGDYDVSSTIDLRSAGWFLENGAEYSLIVSVENESHIKDSFEYTKTFIKQDYSDTQIQIYNQEKLTFDYWLIGGDILTVGKEIGENEETLSSFADEVKLIVLDIDEEGLGLTPEGNVTELRYGICQDRNDLENLELNYVISEYSSYDWRSEDKELEPKMKTVAEEWILYNYSNELDYLGSKLDVNYFIERNGVTEIYDKYRKNAEDNKSIIRLQLPDNLDEKKDVFIKITSENGVNNSEYVVFTIPAPPMVIGVNHTETNLSVDLFSENNNASNYVYVYNSKLKTWKKTNEMYGMDGFVFSNFYAGSFISSEPKSNYTSEIQRLYNLHSLGIKKYETEIKDSNLIRFPSNTLLNIESNGLNSEKHTISMELAPDIFRQFDGVFLKYQKTYSTISEPLTLPENNLISFEVMTTNFYAPYTNCRTNYSFSIFGVKDGKTYETVYQVSADDSRIVDNVSPVVPVEAVFDFATMEMIYTNLVVDPTGNFLTIMGTPEDIGNNLAETIPVKITYKNGSGIIEELNIEGLITNFLNIPIGHLENGFYIIDVTIKDKMGNVGTISLNFEINRESIQDKVKVEKLSENKFRIKSEELNAKNYNLSYFDIQNNSWKAFSIGCQMKSSEEGPYTTVSEDYEKTGLFQIHLNNQVTTYKYNNYYKFPYTFHFPEEHVSVRDYQLWRNTIRLNSDKPFFIHFINSDIDWGKNTDLWEDHQCYSYSMNEDESYIPWIEKIKVNIASSEILNKASPFEGTEVEPCYITGDYSETSYICQIPWEKLDRKYAAAVVIWADNKRDLIPIDMTLKN